jgi:Outer membrane protein beta-barrel domain
MNVFKYVSAIVLSTAVFSAQAQQVSIGARGGVSLGTVTRPEFIKGFTNSASYITSGNGGVFAEIAFGEHFALRPELAYVQKGLSTNAGTNLTIGSVDLPVGARVGLRVSHIQMPILTQYTFGQGPLKGYILAGPAMALAVNAKLVTRPELLLTFRPIRTNIDLDVLRYNKFEVSGVVGGGMSVALGSSGTKLMLEGRYEHGFTRVVNVPLVQVNTFNQNISFLAGISVPIN